MSEALCQNTENKQMRQIRYRLFAVVLTLILFFSLSAGGIEAYGESVGNTHMSGIVVAPESPTPDSDMPESTDSSDDGETDASGTRDSGSMPTASGGARTGDVSRMVFYSLPLMAAAVAAGLLVRRRGATEPAK